MSARTSSILFAALLWPCVALQAQKPRAIESQPADTTALFSGVAVGVDVLGAGLAARTDYGQYEAMARISLRDKVFPTVEVGLGKADADDETTRVHYASSAPYFRLGADFNMMRNKHDDYRVYVGGRYAFSSFKYDISSQPITDPVYGGTTPYEALGEKATWHWLEAVVGVDAKIVGPVKLGWTLRYRRRLVHSDGDAGEPWYVPGYGRGGGSRIGGTFMLTFEL